MELTWGDVLRAAIDACCAAGTDATVEDHELPHMVRAILGARGVRKRPVPPAAQDGEAR